MSHYYDDCYSVLKEADVFPIEVDLSRTTLTYTSHTYTDQEEDEEPEEEPEHHQEETQNGAEKLIDDE